MADTDDDRPGQVAFAGGDEIDPQYLEQVVAGRLLQFPRANAQHVRATSFLGGMLVAPMSFGFGGPGTWWIFDEPVLRCHSDVVVPDLVGWRRERMPALPRSNLFDLAPDWVCEVLSPATERLDRTEKLFIYAREGVSHVWLVDPNVRTLEVMRLHEGHWTLLRVHSDQEVVRAEPFETVQLELALLWG